MGIPSYFSYIIKNHSNIIRTLSFHRKNAKTVFHSLYMDCNSIVYDSVYSLEKTSPNTNREKFEQDIIDTVIAKIREYIAVISPTNVAYIAFDGVAPFAKMEQQRQRRYKSAYMSMLQFDDPTKPVLRSSPPTNKWNTSAITPGTQFMANLSRQVNEQLHNIRIHNCRLIVSTSNDPGEGEHKMFEYMRNHTNPTENVAVYGLDSDLIMLSINHAKLCRNIYITRETPEFGKILPANINPQANELLLLDTNLLCKSILTEMNCRPDDTRRVDDYVFMCFLLGNDFLPHLPAINIRRNGIQQILDIYSTHIGKYPDRTLTTTDPVVGLREEWVKVFFAEIARLEHTFLVEEYTYRNKLSASNFCSLTKNTPKERENLFQKTPLIYRGDEHYICPTEEGWEDRYYRVILGKDPTPELVDELCRDYIHMLSGVQKYYSSGVWLMGVCIYAPLMRDVYAYLSRVGIPNSGSNYSMEVNKDANVLLYVIPKESSVFEEMDETSKEIVRNHPEYFPKINELTFNWLFNNYFWECHVKLPVIPLRLFTTNPKNDNV